MSDLDFRKRVVAIDIQLSSAEPPMDMVPLLQEKATTLPVARDLIHDAVQLGYSAAVMAYHKFLLEALQATTDERDDRNKRAKDMRERAAKAVEELLARSEWSVGYTDFRMQHIDCRDHIAAAIRALPIDAAQEGE